MSIGAAGAARAARATARRAGPTARRLGAIAAGLAAALAACAAPPPPPPAWRAPATVVARGHDAGTAFGPAPAADLAAVPSGVAPAGGEAATGGPAEALRVVVAFVHVEALPERLGPACDLARVVVDDAGGLQAGVRLLGGARAAVGAEADGLDARVLGGAWGEAAAAGRAAGALLPGTAFEAALEGGRGARVAARVRRGAAGLNLAVALRLPADDAPGGAASPRGEALLLALGPRPGAAAAAPAGGAAPVGRLLAAVAVPSPFGPGAVLVHATVEPAPAPHEQGHAGHALAFADLLGDLRGGAVRDAARAEAAAGLAATSARPADLPVRPALERLRGGAPRGALVLLAAAAGSALASDAALALDDAAIVALARDLADDLDAPGAPREGARLRWPLERAAARQVTRLAAAGDLVALGVATRHLGVVGADALEALLLVVADEAGWDAALREENLDGLEDAEPGRRARALAWLARRGVAVPGYDPFAPPAARRAALGALEGEVAR